MALKVVLVIHGDRPHSGEAGSGCESSVGGWRNMVFACRPTNPRQCICRWVKHCFEALPLLGVPSSMSIVLFGSVKLKKKVISFML